MDTSKNSTLINLRECQREEAFKKFQVIQPFLEGQITLKELSKQKEISMATLKRWIRRYQQKGLVALSRKERADKMAHKKFKRELVMFVEGLVLKTPALSVASIYRNVQELSKNKGWEAPSYISVYRIIKNIAPGLFTLGREGSKAYSDQYEIICRREASRPNEIWQADHSLLDIWLLNEKDQPDRPWLTIIIDDYSRAIAGYYLSFDSPSAIQTSLALHQAIWPKTQPNWHICGIPDVFYTDNGSDFISKHLEQVAADIKMRPVFSIPGKPRGRGKIERFFETVNQLFLSLQPGYSKDGKLKSTKPTMRLKELDAKFLTFLLETYHTKEHTTTGVPPQTKWEEHGFLPRLPESLELLDLLLLTVPKTRKIQPDGIKFQGFLYFHLNLAPYVREDVVIRYDPRDLAQIRVYYQNQFLCIATCQELEGETVNLKEIIRARSRHKKALRKQIQDRSAVIDQLLYPQEPRLLLPTDEETKKTTEVKKEQPKIRLKKYENE